MSLKIAEAGCLLLQGSWERDLDIDKLATVAANRVIVPRQVAVVAGGLSAKADLGYQALGLEIAKRVVNGRERYAGQKAPCILKHFVGREVFVRSMDHVEHGLTLFGKACVFAMVGAAFHVKKRN